jgi:hypothetical protein
MSAEIPSLPERRFPVNAEDALPESPRQAESSTDYLPRLNRHWYRRCLDALDADLRKVGDYPTVEEIRDLCGRVVREFLKSVTGQAPDADRLQFPADRAYYIPFEGDNGGRFGFAKSFYRFPRSEELPKSAGWDELRRKEMGSSLWAVFPWVTDQSGQTEAEAIGIDNELWQRAEDGSVTLEEMLSIRNLFRTTVDQGPELAVEDDHRPRLSLTAPSLDVGMESVSAVVVQKAIHLPGPSDRLVERMLEAEPVVKALRQRLGESLTAIFELFRANPGNVAVEQWLSNHLNFLRWLFAAVDGDWRKRGKVVLPISQTEAGSKAVFTALVSAYFGISDEAGADPTDEELRLAAQAANFLVGLVKYLIGGDEKTDNTKEAESTVSYLGIRAKYGEGSSFAAVVGIEAYKRYKQLLDRKEPATRQDASVLKVAESLNGLMSFFGSFWEFMRRQAETERRVSDALTASLGPAAMWAGGVDRSFVNVCRDFPTISASIQPPFDVNEDEQTPILFERVVSAYKEFFRRLDDSLIRELDRNKLIRNYWRMEGVPGREPLVYGSFKQEDEYFLGPAPLARPMPTDPRPQSLFLRVCVRDTTNEPLVNGLFVFTTDYDEVAFRQKSENVRNVEDVEDLFTFAKVYFFIVRDFVRGLDQAREARDIGRLNQELFDKRLAQLAEVMARARTSLQSDSRGGTAGLTSRRQWPEFIYRVFNHYAASLLEKDPQVRIETFPYDRVLILPFGVDQALDASAYQLPFFLFQSVFLERKDGAVIPGRYSLVKPFQSPVEALDEGIAANRFISRSFQQQSEVKGRPVPRDTFLEKRYIGTDDSPDRLPVYVPQRFGATNGAGSKDAPPDSGREWAREVLGRFWTSLHPDKKEATSKATGETSWNNLWQPFLRHLTAEYREHRSGRSRPGDDSDRLFWFRIGLLAATVQFADSPRERSSTAVDGLAFVRDRYRIDLRMLFDDDKSLDVLAFAKSLTPRHAAAAFVAADDESSGTGFGPFELDTDASGWNAWVIRLLNLLATSVSNKDLLQAKSAGAQPLTQYPSWLCRPFMSASKEETPASLHEAVAKAIGTRQPEAFSADARFATSVRARGYFGLVNVAIGDQTVGERDRRYLSCAVVLLRDYDEVRFGSRSDEEARSQAETDCRDLRLFTETYFENVQKFANDAFRARQVQVLSKDINQIARNWYTRGIDAIVRDVQGQIDGQLRTSAIPDLGRLHPAVIDQFFDSVLKVLLDESDDQRRAGAGARAHQIDLESFPFDRLLHIPLDPEPDGSNSGGYLRLAYMRTTIEPKSGPSGSGEWAVGKKTSPEVYAKIRERGRVWDVEAEGGRKIRAFRSLVGVGPGGSANRSDAPWKLALTAWAEKLARWFDKGTGKNGVNSRGSFDETELVRRLYKSDPLEALAVAGLFQHILRQLDGPHRMSKRLRAVIDDRVKALERVASDSLICTAAELQNQAWLLDWDAVESNRDVGEGVVLPGFAELFEALEETGTPTSDESRESYQRRRAISARYGLTESSPSKVFFVYYSIPLPDSFAESRLGDGRYRGILCLVVDDASTDVKDAEGAETDRADIRTFVHNAVSNLRLLFHQQALQNQFRQPGVEESITGMLHKLKNDLSRVSLALDTTGKIVARWPDNEDQAEKHAVTTQFKSARGVVDGIQEVFNQLKKLSDLRRDEICLSQLSTDWLGWRFVMSASRAALGLLGELGERGAVASDGIRKVLANAACRLSGQKQMQSAGAGPDPTDDQNWDRLTPSDQTSGVDEQEAIRDCLRELQDHLTNALRVASGRNQDRLSLGFQVFASTPLVFQASQLFCEAFHILFENALQAVWQYAHRNIATNAVMYRIGVICAPAEEGEISIEMYNTGELPGSLRELLNSNPPKPVSRTVHNMVSQKKGGSGFGHYFARRIVIDFCGGSQARRPLDISIRQPDEAIPYVVSRIRLLGSLTAMPVLVRDFGKLVQKAFPSADVLAPGDVHEETTVPAGIDLERLFERVAALLRDERSSVVQELEQCITDAPMNEIAPLLRLFPQATESALRSVAKGKNAKRFQSASTELSNCEMKFDELVDWLKRNADLLPVLQSVDESRWLAQVDSTTNVPSKFSQARELIEQYLQRGTLTIADMVSADKREEILSDLQDPTNARHLSREATLADVDALIDAMSIDPQSGQLLLPPGRLQALLKPLRWLIVRAKSPDRTVVYRFTLTSRTPSAGDVEDSVQQLPVPAATIVKRFGNAGRWFNRFHEVLAALPGEDRGSLEFFDYRRTSAAEVIEPSVRLVLGRRRSVGSLSSAGAAQ